MTQMFYYPQMNVNSSMNLEDEVRYLVLALQREGNRQLAQGLAPASVTPSQAEAISLLAQHKVLSLRDLGTRLVCETGDSPSRLIDRLVNRGLVRKVRSEVDRRAISLTLTDLGIDLYKKTVEPSEQMIRQSIRESLSKEDLTKLRSLLSRMAEKTGANIALQARRELPKG